MGPGPIGPKPIPARASIAPSIAGPTNDRSGSSGISGISGISKSSSAPGINGIGGITGIGGIIGIGGISGIGAITGAGGTGGTGGLGCAPAIRGTDRMTPLIVSVFQILFATLIVVLLISGARRCAPAFLPRRADYEIGIFFCGS